MDTTVEKLEAMFQKSEADLDYMEKRLKLGFIQANNTTDAPAEESLVGLLENLGPIKAKHAALCLQVKEIAAAHQESMDSIRSQLDGTLQIIQHFQHTGEAEITPLTETEQEAAHLCSLTLQAAQQNTADVTPVVTQQQQHSSRAQGFVGLSEAELEAVPADLRSNVTLTDLNAFYLLLHQHLSSKTSGFLTLQKMKQWKTKASNAKLKILQHLSLVELDKKGHLRLVTCDG